MGAYADDSVSEGEAVLYSSYKSVPVPTLTSKSAAEYVINKAKEQAKGPERVWITDVATNTQIYIQELENLVIKASSAMAQRGMVKGDVALYMTMDVTKIYTTILGIWRLGGTMYASYPEDTEDTLLARIVSSKAKWIFCDPVSIPQVKSALKCISWDVEIIVFQKPVEGCTYIEDFYNEAGDECPPAAPAELEDPILILCTSGTTGNSKGAVYTNRNVLAFCAGTTGIPIMGDNPMLLLLRVTHVLGILFPIRNVTEHNIMMSVVAKTNIFRAVHDYKPCLVFGFPTFICLMVVDPEAKNYDFSSLRAIVSGGIILTKKYYDLMMSLPNVKYVLNGYGMTECGALTTTIDLTGTTSEFTALKDAPIDSVGKLYPNTELKILDLDTGKALGPNQRGEITIKSPIMCSSYWNLPEESAATFQDGWMRTGDLGYYDENGYVYIVDRIKETFKYFNNHISPAEIEAVILKHSAVAEACVFGIPDPAGGDRIPRAVISLKPGMEVPAEEIREFVDDRVAPYKKLRGGIFTVPQIPKGKTGKVVRSMVANMPLVA